MTAGPLPESTVFEGDASATEAEAEAAAAPLAARSLVGITSTACSGQSTALLQDNVPWVAGNATLDPNGLGANGIELAAQGGDFCVLRSSDLGVVPLAGFARIVISSAQSQTFYNRVFPSNAIHPAIDAYVSGGGTLIANLADGASGPGNGGSWSGRSFVGGVRKALRHTSDNDIAPGAASHPVISGNLPCSSSACGQVRDWEEFTQVDIDDWNYSSHGYFTGLPAGATPLITDGSGPALVEYAHGEGHVVASMLTTEWRYLGGFSSYVQNQALLANLLSYRYRQDCAGDYDCDGLTDTVERSIGTSSTLADTDGDALLDPWEVAPSVPGAGFRDHYPDGPLLPITRDEVFGPYGKCVYPDHELRITAQMSCFNAAPDPRQKDVYLELDWQDCLVDGCPEPPVSFEGVSVDPLHHAPNFSGIANTVGMFRRAPVTNPNGQTGVRLNVLIDERIAHSVNCDQDESEQRAASFGTPQQRRDAHWSQIARTRDKAVRYAWSGHSTRSEGGCPNPPFADFVQSGFGLRNFESYDYSPAGDANIGGRDLLVSLGILWSCPAAVGVNVGINPGICYRPRVAVPTIFGPKPARGLIPGIYPGRVTTPSGDVIDANYPIARLLGLTEQAGAAQLWERTLAHLLGHAMGLRTEDQVGNRPDVVGAGTAGSKTTRHSHWYSTAGTRLIYAPKGNGVATLDEDEPRYTELAEADSDGDGTPEGKDNCPGIPNPGQRDLDRDYMGNVCDGDVDGDGRVEFFGEDIFRDLTVSLASRMGFATAAVEAPAVDQFPNDTDNDGETNDVDADDDGDSIADVADNCDLHANSDQTNNDGDAEGDACDLDDDNDGLVDSAELFGGSDPLSSTNTWEMLGWKDSCSDGRDNDGDGTVDGPDLGCTDTDDDTQPDLLDACPRTPSRNMTDSDGDGLGDVCDDTPYGSTVRELWMADNKDIHAVNSDGTHRQIDPSTLGAIAVEVDDEAERVWTYGDRTLRALSFEGKQLVAVQVPEATDNEQKVTIAIGVGGDVWLATKRVLSRFSADGTLLAQRTLSRDVVAMAIDGSTQSMWVASDNGVEFFNAKLTATRRIALDARPGDIAVDTDSTLWVTVGTELRGYRPASTTPEHRVALGGVTGVVEVAGGQVWVGVHDRVARYSPADRKHFVVDPFPGSSGPVIHDLAADATGMWAADVTKARLITFSGELGTTVTLPTAGAADRRLRDIAVVATGLPEAPVAKDKLGVMVLSPADGASVGGDVVVVDGLVSAAAAVTVNGVSAQVSADLRFEARVGGLAEGLNRLTVVATDAKGGTAQSIVPFFVDRTAPARATVDTHYRVSNNLVQLTGRTEPGAVVEVHNASLTEGDIRATVIADDDGKWSVTLLAASGHLLDVVIRDEAGNASPTHRVVAY